MISDTHFCDDGTITRYERRPFQNSKEMDEEMIANWNRVVKPEDTIYHLGDFVCEANADQTESVIRQLNGRKILIMGNHDQRFSPKEWREMGFDEVYPLPVILDDFFMLSHEPLYINRISPYANIFGHVHNNPAYRTASSRSFCVCVERMNYAPVSFEDIKKAIWEEDRRENEN